MLEALERSFSSSAVPFLGPVLAVGLGVQLLLGSLGAVVLVGLDRVGEGIAAVPWIPAHRPVRDARTPDGGDPVRAAGGSTVPPPRAPPALAALTV